jgi:hypothetical protein
MAELRSAIFWVLNCPIYLLRCYIWGLICLSCGSFDRQSAEKNCYINADHVCNALKYFKKLYVK